METNAIKSVATSPLVFFLSLLSISLLPFHKQKWSNSWSAFVRPFDTVKVLAYKLCNLSSIEQNVTGRSIRLVRIVVYFAAFVPLKRIIIVVFVSCRDLFLYESQKDTGFPIRLALNSFCGCSFCMNLKLFDIGIDTAYFKQCE